MDVNHQKFATQEARDEKSGIFSVTLLVSRAATSVILHLGFESPLIIPDEVTSLFRLSRFIVFIDIDKCRIKHLEINKRPQQI